MRMKVAMMVSARRMVKKVVVGEDGEEEEKVEDMFAAVVVIVGVGSLNKTIFRNRRMVNRKASIRIIAAKTLSSVRLSMPELWAGYVGLGNGILRGRVRCSHGGQPGWAILSVAFFEKVLAGGECFGRVSVCGAQ
jgi:hypothetical protein